MNTENNAVTIAIIGSLAAILGAFGAKDITLSVIAWWKEKRDAKRKAKEEEKEEVKKLAERIDKLEDEVAEYKNFKVRTETAFQTLLPVIREIMREHPAHIALFDQLKNTIFGEQSEADVTPTDGENND